MTQSAVNVLTAENKKLEAELAGARLEIAEEIKLLELGVEVLTTVDGWRVTAVKRIRELKALAQDRGDE